MQHENETAIEYLRRIINCLNYETETILQTLPNTQAVLEYFQLWNKYNTGLMTGIKETIEDGANPKPLLDFIKKYNLNWDTNWIPKPNTTVWTDYPFTELGDPPCQEAPVREAKLIEYDNDKYATISIQGTTQTVKLGYLYTKPGRLGMVPSITHEQAQQLLKTHP